MRVLIVDDEPAARRRLALMLADLDVEVVGEAANGVEALEQVAARRPDVLLLDIAMPEVDGFDVARHLPKPGPLVIFQTAYDRYALDAFDHEAVDYIVKPVNLARLERALERGRRALGEGRAGGLSRGTLARLRGSLGAASWRKPRLLVRSGRGHRLVPLAEIVRFKAHDGLVYAHSEQGRSLTDYTLAELEERTAGLFVRANRADLVAIDAVERIVPNGDGSATLTLCGGTSVRTSRRRTPEVKRSLES